MIHTRAQTTNKGKQIQELEKGLCSVVRVGTDRRYILAPAQNAQTPCTLQVVPHAASARYASDVQVWHTGTDMNRDKISESFAEERDCSTPTAKIWFCFVSCRCDVRDLVLPRRGTVQPQRPTCVSDLWCLLVCVLLPRV